MSGFGSALLLAGDASSGFFRRENRCSIFRAGFVPLSTLTIGGHLTKSVKGVWSGPAESGADLRDHRARSTCFEDLHSHGGPVVLGLAILPAYWLGAQWVERRIEQPASMRSNPADTTAQVAA